MKTRKTITLAIIAIAACVCFLAANSSPVKASPEPIKIGLVIAFSGAPAKHGFACQNGYKMAIEEINAKGGVLGRPLQLVSRDSKVNTQTARAMAKELLLKERVFMIVGAVPGSICMALW
jgi:branched-chain amino acid transport system substrate-binding protein